MDVLMGGGVNEEKDIKGKSRRGEAKIEPKKVNKVGVSSLGGI
jgi:hypothetical protein